MVLQHAEWLNTRKLPKPFLPPSFGGSGLIGRRGMSMIIGSKTGEQQGKHGV